MNKPDNIDWRKLLEDIQKKSFLSQTEIAEICGVARQTVSNWKKGFRNPGYQAKRKLLELAHGCGKEISSKNGTTAKIPKFISIAELQNADTEYATIKKVFDRLTPRYRRELLDFGEFLTLKTSE